MLLISNNGNIIGRNPTTEATLDQLIATINQGFSVKFALWIIQGRFATGIDYPSEMLPPDFVEQLGPDKILIDAKNPSALSWCHSNNIHFFFRENDVHTVTNRGIILSFGELALPRSVAMEADKCVPEHLQLCLGLCSDFIGAYK